MNVFAENDVEMQYEGRRHEAARALQKHGFNCAQSVALVFCEKYGISCEHMQRMTCGFGSGLQMAEVCGALAGAIVIVGCKHGGVVTQESAQIKEAKVRCKQEIAPIVADFREKFGCVRCRDLLGHDVTTKEGFDAARHLLTTFCTDIIGETVKILEKHGY